MSDNPLRKTSVDVPTKQLIHVIASFSKTYPWCAN